MAWTEDRVELLKKLWGDGYSASQIAAQLGEVTRNAVIGKAHRLGLSGRQSTRPAASRGGAAAQKKATPTPSPARRPQVGASSSGAQAGVSAVSQTVISRSGAARKLDIAASLDTQAADDLAIAPMSLRVIDGTRGGTVSLLDLKERMCKWPIGDPGDDNFRFCGGKATPGQPYCDDHCDMAFQPTSRSRDRKG
ncbi:MAG: GcrA family cell cycle regulator [Alphaproteobacteria bacterium]